MKWVHWGIATFFIFCSVVGAQDKLAPFERVPHPVSLSKASLLKCLYSLANFAQRDIFPGSRVRSVLKHTGKAFFYPFVASTKLVQAARGPRENYGIRAFFRGVRRDLPHMIIYGGLATAGFLSTITEAQMHRSISRAEPDERVVVLNGFKPASRLYDHVETRFQKQYGENSQAKIENPPNWNEAIDRMVDYRNAHGPIQRLEIHGHGLAGIAGIGNDTISGSAIRLITAFRRGKFQKFLSDRSLPADLFAPDAQIVVYICSAGRGPDGDDLLKSLAEVAGEVPVAVHAVKVPMHSSFLSESLLPVSMPQAEKIQQVADVALAPFHFVIHLIPNEDHRVELRFELDRVKTYRHRP